MTDEYLSTQAILDRLKSERDSLVTRFEAIPADLRDRRPDPTCWSIAEVLEHVGRVESGVTKLMTLRGQAAPPAETPRPEASSIYTPALGLLVSDRSQRMEAPERVRPSGSIASHDALAHLATTRAGLLSAFSSANLEALELVTHPHPLLGLLTLRSWMALLADHDIRHSGQIDEIAERLRVA